MTPAKKPSGIRKEDPKRSLEDFQYLLQYLTPNPVFSHEGWVFALKFPGVEQPTFIQYREERSFLFAHMKDLARFLNAELVQVKGTWTWEPIMGEEADSESVAINEPSEEERRTENE